MSAHEKSNAFLVLGAIAALLSAGCGGSTPSSPTTGQATAAIQLSATPSTIVYAVCPPSHCGPLTDQNEIEGTIVIRETAGVSLTVTRLGLTIRRRSDDAAIAANDVVAAGGPIRVGGGTTVSVPIAMHFDASASEDHMKLVVVIDAADDNGHSLTSSMEIEILPQ
jgi:hypothetical protein